MKQLEANQYILGTETAELHRLGVQHQVWASEAQSGWNTANFTAGQTLLDLGCGPGFATKELAYIVGETGKVIGIDISKTYIDFLQKVAELHSLNIEATCMDFNEMKLEKNSIDGMYCRWALAWVPTPLEILDKVYHALKPGGKMVIHEYFDWSTHQTNPHKPALAKAIAACLKSFKEQPGDIDVGRFIPSFLAKKGMKITTRPITRLASPSQLTWQWPKTFYKIYFPKLVYMNYLSQQEVEDAFSELTELEKDSSSLLFCPSLIEIVAEKI